MIDNKKENYEVMEIIVPESQLEDVKSLLDGRLNVYAYKKSDSDFIIRMNKNDVIKPIEKLRELEKELRNLKRKIQITQII
jgi:predicted CopG family antitoxin